MPSRADGGNSGRLRQTKTTTAPRSAVVSLNKLTSQDEVEVELDVDDDLSLLLELSLLMDSDFFDSLLESDEAEDFDPLSLFDSDDELDFEPPSLFDSPLVWPLRA